jgi:hypothetical protein
LTADNAITSLNPIAVTGWTTHPDWSVEHNDVGVLHLDSSVDDLGLTPVTVAPVGFLDQKRDAGELKGHTFTVSGYGLNGTDRFFWSPQANVIFHGQRESGPAQFQSLTQDRLHDVSGACGGDSGSPLFYSSDANSVIVSVGSTGPGSCAGPAEEQRLDTESVHEFLAHFMP